MKQATLEKVLVESENINQITNQLKNLYISNKKGYLRQNKLGYATVKHDADTNKGYLWDSILLSHLRGKATIGILLGEYGLTKFQCFDVDADNAEEVTIKLVRALNEYWGIPLEEIHISFSGSKGYHVELFYNKARHYSVFQAFYHEVLDYIGESMNSIEFRCSKQGMKLPLGLHQKTGKFTAFCTYNPVTQQLKKLTPKQSYNYFLGIKQSDYFEFKELVFDDLEVNAGNTLELDNDKAEDFESTMSTIDLQGKSIDDLNAEIALVLNQNRLTYPSTRNRVTFLLSVFLKEQGYTLEQSISIINGVMTNTYDNFRELISADTTREYMLSEVHRIASNSFLKGYQLSTNRKEIELTEAEILDILAIKKWHLKQLAFIMLVNSKRYAKADGSFYLAYSVMQRMGATENRSRIKQYIDELEQMGKIQVESRNVIDLYLSRINNQVIKKPNIYKVLMNEQSSDNNRSIKLEVSDSITLEEVTSQLIEEKKAKKILPRKQFENYFKERYELNSVAI